MGIWGKLFSRHRRSADAAPAVDDRDSPEAEAQHGNTVELPAEPFVFECQSCGKVFEARRKRPQCPECDSREISLLSE